MVVEHEVGFSSEFEPGSPEAIAMAKVEPILRRPVAYHTIVSPNGIEELSEKTQSILTKGLLSGQLLEGIGNEDVYAEVARHREKFEPALRRIYVPPGYGFYNNILEKLSYQTRGEVLKEWGFSAGLSLLIERDALDPVGKRPSVDRRERRTFGKIPAEKIKGIVILATGNLSADFQLELSPETIIALRQDALDESDRYWQDPALIFEDLLRSIRNNEYISWLHGSQALQFVSRLFGYKTQDGRRLRPVREMTLFFREHAEALQEFAESCYRLPQNSAFLNDIEGVTERVGYDLWWGSSNTSVQKWLHSLGLQMLIKIYKRRRDIGELIESDYGSLSLQPISLGELVGEIKEVVASSPNPVPIFDDFGNLIYPKRMSSDEILERWQKEQRLEYEIQ